MTTKARLARATLVLLIVISIVAQTATAGAQTIAPPIPTIPGAAYCIQLSVICGSGGQVLEDTGPAWEAGGFPALVVLGLLAVGVAFYYSNNAVDNYSLDAACRDTINADGGFPSFNVVAGSSLDNSPAIALGNGAYCVPHQLLSGGLYTATMITTEPWQRSFCQALDQEFQTGLLGTTAGVGFQQAGNWPIIPNGVISSGSTGTQAFQAAIGTACPAAWMPFFDGYGTAPSVATPGTGVMTIDANGNAGYCSAQVGSPILIESLSGGAYWYTTEAWTYSISCNLMGVPNVSSGRHMDLLLQDNSTGQFQTFTGYDGCMVSSYASPPIGYTSPQVCPGSTAVNNVNKVYDLAGNPVNLFGGFNRGDPSGSHQWLEQGLIVNGTTVYQSTCGTNCRGAVNNNVPSPHLTDSWQIKIDEIGCTPSGSACPTVTVPGMPSGGYPGVLENLGVGGGTIVQFPSYPTQAAPNGAPTTTQPGVVVPTGIPSTVTNPSPATSPTIPGANPSNPPTVGTAPPTTVVGTTSPDGNTGTTWLGNIFDNAVNWLGNFLATWLALIVSTLQWLGTLITHLELAVVNAINVSIAALQSTLSSLLSQVITQLELMQRTLVSIQVALSQIPQLIVTGLKSALSVVVNVAAPVVNVAAPVVNVTSSLSIPNPLNVFVTNFADLETLFVPTSSPWTGVQTEMSTKFPLSVMSDLGTATSGLVTVFNSVPASDCGPALDLRPAIQAIPWNLGSNPDLSAWKINLPTPASSGCPPMNGVARSSEESFFGDMDGYRLLVKSVLTVVLVLGVLYRVMGSFGYGETGLEVDLSGEG
ncbi:MAG TPA: hypothetical protein VHT30_01495 [Acidimicrobiales bacterium]|jgi:hypothetical protein|nr:hypothetical protein [Acidimicrobiales bacterium]